MHANLIEYFTAQLPAMLERLKELVEHESPSTDKRALDEMARRLKTHFQATGAKASIVSDPVQGDHLTVVYGSHGGPPDARPALVLCHSDTVWPVGTLDRRPFRVEKNRALGPGGL